MLGCLSRIVLSFPFFVSIFDFIQCAECSHTPALRALLIVSLVNADYVEFCWICASLFCFFLLCFLGGVFDYMCLNIKINATCQRETGSGKRGLDPGKQTFFGCCYN